MKKQIQVVVGIIVLAGVAGLVGYAIATQKTVQVEQKLSDAIAEIDKLTTGKVGTSASATSTTSLADAIALVSVPSAVRGGRLLSGSLYWVNGTVAVPDVQGRKNYSWIVDVASKKTIQTITRDEGFPMEPTVTTPQESDKYLIATWDNGWEGATEVTTDYFDKATGVLAYSFVLNSNPEAILQAGDKKLAIKLDPPNGCSGDPTEKQKKTAVVNGLSVNDEAHPFAKPVTVNCIQDAMSASGQYPEFSYISLTANDIEIGLPWKQAVKIPFDLDAKKIVTE